MKPTCYDRGHQVASYTAGGGNQLNWIEVEGGQLPKTIYGPRAVMVDNVLYVTGGIGVFWTQPPQTSILSWNPLSKSWEPAGNLKMGRSEHAAVAVPSSIIECPA